MAFTKDKRVGLAVATAGLTLALALAAGCAPQVKTADTGAEVEGADAPAVQVAWSADGDCTVCHTKEGDSMGTIPCAAGGEADCVMCHTDTSALETVHADATTDSKMPKRLKQTEVAAESCESCHGTTEELAAATADSTVLTDSKGTTVNPHDLPANDRHSEIVCADCHNPHDGTPQETGPKACATCHHAGVYECGTCHEEK